MIRSAGGLGAGLVGAASLLAIAACGRHAERASPAPGPAGVLLITIDTLRPDALGWVAGRNPTPVIDRLAAGGFRFPAAVAPAPLTLPSHAAMLTGRLPSGLGLRDNGQALPAEIPTLAATLRQAGYATAAFVSGFPLAARFGLGRGFDVYDDRLAPGPDGDLERSAEETTAAASAWLRTAKRPWFAWVHYYDPHYPYTPPAELRRPGWRGAYDGEVARVDQALAGLLEAAGEGPDRLTLLAADHGESLGEHGEGTHGFFIYDSTVLVPLVVRFDGRLAPGASTLPARLVDVTPTVLDLLGLPAVDADGRSLRHLMAGGGDVPAAYVETWQPWTSYGWAPLKAVRDGRFKLIRAPRPELYDLQSDPGESRNLFGQRKELAARLDEQLRRIEAGEAAPAASGVDPEARERLAALGYVGGGRTADPPARGLRDPKDGAALRDRLTEADRRLRRGDDHGAMAAFGSVLAEEPDNRFALLRSGFALVRLGRSSQAVPRLERAAALDPENAEVRSALADALVRAGRPADAVAHWQEVTRLLPRAPEGWVGLGTACGLAGRHAEAVQALAGAVALEPDRPMHLVRLALAENGLGRLDDAARHLVRAAELSGAEFGHAGALGLILVRLGRPAEARRWLAASRRAEGDFAEARLELAALLAQDGRHDAARQALQEALSAAPGLRARARADERLAPLLAGQ